MVNSGDGSAENTRDLILTLTHTLCPIKHIEEIICCEAFKALFFASPSFISMLLSNARIVLLSDTFWSIVVHLRVPSTCSANAMIEREFLRFAAN